MLKGFVSVVLPFRNAGATIEAALAGLLMRDDAALEVLAVDDGSCDAGPALVRTWAQREARLRLFSTSGRGLVAALQRGVHEARGELIARMDADDIAHPERLSRQRAYLLQHTHLAALGTRVEAFADDGELGGGMHHYVQWQNSLLTPEDHRRELFVESPLCHPSLMIRRDAMNAVGGYLETGGPEDYELFLRLDHAGLALAKLPEVLLSWRHRAGRATFSDARYSFARMRSAKAPFLAARALRTDKQRHVLWGAGPTGRRLARELEAHGLRVACFVDIDPRKLGGVARGCPIVPPDALDSARDHVIAAVGARGARALIRADLTARGFIEGHDALFAA